MVFIVHCLVFIYWLVLFIIYLFCMSCKFVILSDFQDTFNDVSYHVENINIYKHLFNLKCLVYSYSVNLFNCCISTNKYLSIIACDGRSTLSSNISSFNLRTQSKMVRLKLKLNLMSFWRRCRQNSGIWRIRYFWSLLNTY